MRGFDDAEHATLARLRGAETEGIRRLREPVTVGLPLPRGAARGAGEIGIRRAGGEPLPVQAAVAEKWPDGSVRWALLDFAVDADPRAEIRVDVLRATARPDPPATLRVNRAGRGFFVDTGAAQFTVDPDAFLPLRSARADGVEVLDPGRSGWSCTDDTGGEWTPSVRSAELETEGPLRSTLRVDGKLVRDGADARLFFLARLHFFAASASVRLSLTVRNPRRAAHPGGHWELGDAGSVLFRDLSLRIAAAGGRRVSWSPDPGSPLGELPSPDLELYQDSSGGENWRSPVHRARDGRIPVSFRGYRIRSGDEERDGLRATPRVAIHDGTAGVGVQMREFWQNFPKAMEARDGVLTVRLFPARFDAPHELQGGEQKTHDIWLSFGTDAIAPALDGRRAPLLVLPDPESFGAAGVVPYFTPRARDKNADYVRLVAQALDGDDTFEDKRERADEYGWRNFGDLWADHESKYHEGDDLFVSHFNNQYDAAYGAFLQLARSGDPRWFRLMEEQARHSIDIDVYHTEEDRAAYNRGLFWHTAHYTHAGLANHRSYPKRGTIGGGPANEHNYAAGFAHYFLLTGDPIGRDAAVERAQWILDADDGTKTPLRFLHRGPTGLASKTRSLDFHGPGRGAGNSIQVLLDAWRLGGERRFLDKTVEIIRRTVHPADDPGGHGLLDSESRWSYTVYLQALGRFLDEMVAAGHLGESYAYARAVLLTYARWMAEHERPALDFPERLKYPTETWAAQDIRKSEVLLFAALHSSGDERARFLERADFFHRHSLETLNGFDSKSRTRPVVLLLRYGLMKSWFDRNPDAARPQPEFDGAFPEPVRFVPQKTAALRRMKWIAAGAGAAMAAAVVAGLLR